jgi:hypothetical protein
MRPQSSRAVPPLAFGSNEGTEDQSQAQTNCKMMPQHVSLYPLKPAVQVANNAIRRANCAFLRALGADIEARHLPVNATAEAISLKKLTEEAS